MGDLRICVNGVEMIFFGNIPHNMNDAVNVGVKVLEAKEQGVDALRYSSYLFNGFFICPLTDFHEFCVDCISDLFRNFKGFNK